MTHLLTEGESERAYETRRESLNLHCCGVPGDYCQNVATSQLAKTIAEIEDCVDRTATWEEIVLQLDRWLDSARKEIGE